MTRPGLPPPGEQRATVVTIALPATRRIIPDMELRPELLPPPVSPERIDELSTEIERICGLLERQSPDVSRATSAIADFNTMTGHAYATNDFVRYYESRNLQDFALEAARPAWPRIPDITRDELVELTQRILNNPADLNSPYYLLMLQANVPHPAITDLIYWSAAGTEPTAQEIIDRALSHRPIVL
jgi:hypothetical protein